MISKKTDVYLKGFSKDRVKIKLPVLNLGKIKVYLDGNLVTKTDGAYILQDDKGVERKLILKRSFLDPYPYVFLDEEEYYLVQNHITIYAKLVAFFPFILSMVILKPNLVTIVVPFFFMKTIVKAFYKIEDERMATFYLLFLTICSVPVCYYILKAIYYLVS